MDQKEGALVILLEPFVAGGGRAVAERNVDDIWATLDCARLPLDRLVGVRRGQDHMRRVNRAGYMGVRVRFKASRRSSTRSR